ncbi:hypothetical protein GC177_05500 [bacterium]|nr:hypothetical protein [bacterium]
MMHGSNKFRGGHEYSRQANALMKQDGWVLSELNHLDEAGEYGNILLNVDIHAVIRWQGAPEAEPLEINVRKALEWVLGQSTTDPDLLQHVLKTDTPRDGQTVLLGNSARIPVDLSRFFEAIYESGLSLHLESEYYQAHDLARPFTTNGATDHIESVTDLIAQARHTEPDLIAAAFAEANTQSVRIR